MSIMGTVYHSGLPYGVGAYAATATAAPFPSYLNATAAANTPSNTTANTAANTAAASASSFSSSVSASASASDSKAASSALLDIASYPSSSSVSASSSFASSASSLSTAPSTSGSAFGSLDSYKVHSQSQPRSSYTHIPISSSSSSSTPPTTTTPSASSSSASLASALEPPAAAAAEDEQPKLATAAAPATAPLAPPVLPSTAVDSASTMYAIGSGSLRTHEHQQQHQQLQQHQQQQQQQQQQQASTNDHLHHHQQSQQSQQHSSDLASSLMHPPFQSAADPQPSSSSSSAIATVAANTTAAAMSTASAAPAANSSSAEPKKTGLELHSMALPACISPNGGSLSDFVAQMTCFMIQEPWKIVADACQYTSGSPLPRQRLVPEAIAKPELLKWTQNILATTQVTQNVVLLALLLIYRLKRSNQHLKGHYGSAYRLLTIALMLGNKFLDDNTYTNKTWADVSSISVHEIHHMEVEFLSNMRYSLFVREQQWSAWLKNMANMKAYYDEAARRISSPDPSVLMAAQTYLPPQPLHAHSSHSPSRLSTAYIPSSSGQSHAQLPHALTNASASVNAAESMVYHPELSPSLSAGGLSRKRNYPEHDPQSDARKSRRMSPSRTLSISPSGQMCIPHTANVPLPLGSSVAPMDPINYASAANPPASRDSRRLTLPHLTVNTNTNPMAAAPVPQPQSAFVATTVPSSSNNNNNNNNSQPVFGTLAARTVSSSLPPLASGSRSVVGNSVVNPHTGSSYGGVPPQNLMAMSISQPPVSSHLSQSAAPAYLPPSTTQLSSTGYVTPTKRHSPGTLGRYGFSPHGTNPDIFMNHQGRIPSHSQNSGFAHSHNMATSMPRSPLSPSVQSATLRSAVPHSHPHGVSVSTPLDQTPGAGHQRSPYPTLSPIAYLNDRSSPYRPVRTVNTLMYPPGSTSLSEYHLTPQAITPNSMHWHRVGRPNDIRSGIVPEYRHM